MHLRSWLLAAALVLSQSVGAAASGAQQYSPYADRSEATEVFWGDTHVHSSWSPDAGAGGNTSITPDLAYQFARGDTITAHNGTRIGLRRPLDFLVVSDHSEYMGLYPMLEQKLPALLETEVGCSCCASQICECEPSRQTNEEIFLLNEMQRQRFITPQCDLNGTLCGVP